MGLLLYDIWDIIGLETIPLQGLFIDKTVHISKTLNPTDRALDVQHHSYGQIDLLIIRSQEALLFIERCFRGILMPGFRWL